MCMLACSRIFVVSLSTYLECGLASTKVKKNSEEVEKKGQRKRKTARNGGREREQGGKKGKKDLPRTGLANHSRWAKSGLLPISVHSFLGTHPRTRTCVRCCVLQWPSWAVTPETHWPTKLKMFTLWHFPETVCWPLMSGNLGSWTMRRERYETPRQARAMNGVTAEMEPTASQLCDSGKSKMLTEAGGKM